VRRTGDIALFKILTEGAVAAGVRRIEALTGEAALEHVNVDERLLADAAGALRVTAQELPERVVALLAERRQLEREVAELRQKLATGSSADQAEVQQIRGVPFAGRSIFDVPAKQLRAAADTILRQLGTGVVAVVSVIDGKAALVVSVSDDLEDTVDAVELVQAGVAALGGKGGGGRRDFAQGGGPDGDQADAALAAIARALEGHAAAAE
jgi:alanyl-tRNA synthetase